MFKIAIVFLLFVFSASSFALNKDFHVFQRGTETWIKIKFNPASSGSADVLFVVDNSASMTIHQQNLSDNVTTLLELLPQTSLHAAVLTTTAEKAGSLLTPGHFINGVMVGDTPQFTNKLTSALLVLNNGHWQERPFDSISLALSEPLISSVNQGFLRDDADLYIVILTDTQDQSSIDENQLLTHLKTLKPKNSITTLVGMVTDPKTCEGESGELKNSPPKLQNLVSLTGGSIFSLCGDFAKNLADAVHTSVINESSIVLPKTDDNKSPVFSTLKVSIGSKTYLPGNLHNSWTYNSLTRTVYFSEAMLKDSTLNGPIEIIYQVQ